MADPKATPINALPNGQQQGNGEDEQFIKNILNQMNEDNAEATLEDHKYLLLEV